MSEEKGSEEKSSEEKVDSGIGGLDTELLSEAMAMGLRLNSGIRRKGSIADEYIVLN